ncbi:MAG TPA: WD40 repeat domain-containing protein [Ktedonobacteraceae bacterium]|nr:WD40 repeat domain-containing protein [Ktedonobacteraceae bacterium]
MNNRIGQEFGAYRLTSFLGSSTCATEVNWAPNASRIASPSRGNLSVWYAATGQHAVNYVYRDNLGISHQPLAIAWSPNGKYIASTYEDNVVLIWKAL